MTEQLISITRRNKIVVIPGHILQAIYNCGTTQINNKVKRLALLSVLSDKAANGNMVVVDKFTCDEYKTKAVVAMLNAVGAGKKNLLVNETVDAKFVKSAGNIAGVKTTFAGSVNTYDVLNADKLIISVDAAKKLEEVLG